MKEKTLLGVLEACVADWDSTFSIDVEKEDVYKNWDYFSVIITHETLGHDYEFRARINDNDECEMDYNEDSWTPINMGNLFAWMWFNTAKYR